MERFAMETLRLAGRNLQSLILLAPAILRAVQ
jgi:hypothetical protein